MKYNAWLFLWTWQSKNRLFTFCFIIFITIFTLFFAFLRYPFIFYINLLNQLSKVIYKRRTNNQLLGYTYADQRYISYQSLFCFLQKAGASAAVWFWALLIQIYILGVIHINLCPSCIRELLRYFSRIRLAGQNGSAENENGRFWFTW